MGRAGKGARGGLGGDGEVTVACGGRGREARFQAQAKSECLVGPVVPAVIWVRPGLERQGPDRPRARSFQRQGGTWGRWRLRRGCKASQWGALLRLKALLICFVEAFILSDVTEQVT